MGLRQYTSNFGGHLKTGLFHTFASIADAGAAPTAVMLLFSQQLMDALGRLAHTTRSN